MRSYTLYLLIALNIYSITTDILTPNQKNYGPYIAKWLQYDTCRGPKANNLTSLQTMLLVEGNIYRAALNFTFLVTARVEEVKIAVYGYNTGIKKPLWNYKVDNPCQHYSIGSILKEIGAQNCIVKKGQYYILVNLTESTYQFFGQTFFYGNFLFKIYMLSKSGNIGCIQINTIFTKK